jgi:WxL domain surface cell wall-binding
MRHRILILGAVGAGALVVTAAALGATLTATANVSGAAGISFALPSPPSVSSTLDGTDQTVSYSPLLGVVDARGSGAGWNLTVSATSFSDGSGHTLAPGTLTGVVAACRAGNSCTAATSSGITYPLVLNGTAAKFFNAAAATGLGKFDVTPSVDVSIPGNAYAGTYTSTVTLAVASGP